MKAGWVFASETNVDVFSRVCAITEPILDIGHYE